MAAVITKKASGASILETIVALTIAAFLFSLVTVLFVQVTFSSISIKKIRAHELLQNYLSETGDQQKFLDEDIRQGDFILKKRVTGNDSLPGITRTRFLIYDNNEVLLDQMDVFMQNEKQ
jgi:hypothetical protein